MAKKKAKKAPGKRDEQARHMRMISVVPLERPGVIEFAAWDMVRWLGVWRKPFNVKTEIPHLVFLDCPTLRQMTWRLLVLEGQAPLPSDVDEEWSTLGLQVWQTKRSFATLWISNNCFSKTDEPKRGLLVATEVEARGIHEPDVLAPEPEEMYIP